MAIFILAAWLGGFGLSVNESRLDVVLVQVQAQVQQADSVKEITRESTFENLEGFSALVLKQVENLFGSQHLPSGMGTPVEPGVYVTLSTDKLAIFDHELPLLKEGKLADPTIAEDCLSECPLAFYSAFRRVWLGLNEEAHAIGVDSPSRILWGIEAKLPARTFLAAVYASSESWLGGSVPRLYLLLNGGPAGLRARVFSLLPPQGLVVQTGAQVLGLRVRVEGEQRYVISAVDPKFQRTLQIEGDANLQAALTDINKHYPGKSSLILEAGEHAKVEDLGRVMNQASEWFPRIVLSQGQVIRIGRAQ